MSKSFAIIRSPVNVLVAVVSVVIALLSSWKRTQRFIILMISQCQCSSPFPHPVSTLRHVLERLSSSCDVLWHCVYICNSIRDRSSSSEKAIHHLPIHILPSPAPSPSACYYFTCRSLAHYNLLAICIIFFYKALPLFSAGFSAFSADTAPSTLLGQCYANGPGRNTHGFRRSPPHITVIHDRYQWAFCCPDYCLNKIPTVRNLHSHLLWTLLKARSQISGLVG